MLLIPGIVASSYFAPQGDFESIATVVVGSGGASSIDFNSISGSYQHLQLRYIARGTANQGYIYIVTRLNGITTSSYATHVLVGNASSASSTAYTSQTSIFLDYVPGANQTASIFGAGVVDILDYANTNKNTTTRVLHGTDINTTPSYIALSSGLFNNTAAVSSITLTASAGNFAQYSHFALYGIKG